MIIVRVHGGSWWIIQLEQEEMTLTLGYFNLFIPFRGITNIPKVMLRAVFSRWVVLAAVEDTPEVRQDLQ